MAKIIAGATQSLDGFVADEKGDISLLYQDYDALRNSSLMQEYINETGAVIMGRRTFDMGDPDEYVGNYEFQVPIFILTNHVPEVMPKQDDRLTITYVTDGIASAVRQAKEAAGEKVVEVVGGAEVIKQLFEAGLVDELHIDVVPLFLSKGRRLFDGVNLQGIKLEKIDVRQVDQRTNLRFRVVYENNL